MLRKRRLLVLTTLHLWELLLTAASFLIAYSLRKNLPFEAQFPESIDPFLWLFPLILVLWSVLSWIHGLYREIRSSTSLKDIWKVIKVITFGTVMLFAATYVSRAFYVSRALIGLFALTNLAVLVAHRLLLRSFIRHYVKRGYDRIYVLVAGTGRTARHLVEAMARQKDWGVEVIGFVTEQKDMTLKSIDGHPVVGTIRDIPQLIHQRVVDEVVFAVSRRTLGELDDVISSCDEIGVRVRVSMDYFRGLNSRLYMDHLSGIPLLTFSSAPKSEFKLLVKRLLDMLIAGIAMVPAAPFMILTTLAIKLTSRGPVIFRQKRAGMNGRVFTLYKFRTMVDDAEAKKKELMALNEMDGPVFKIRNDPRITPVGRVLRKLSLDELPQLWNVLRGDMSMVGPRPPIPSEVEKYERWQRRRLSMRPGLTCIWQVKGRSGIDFHQWMELDLEYIDNWSLALDFKIMLQTIPAVLLGKGAS